jgi:hypothetical protein
MSSPEGLSERYEKLVATMRESFVEQKGYLCFEEKIKELIRETVELDPNIYPPARIEYIACGLSITAKIDADYAKVYNLQADELFLKEQTRLVLGGRTSRLLLVKGDSHDDEESVKRSLIVEMETRADHGFSNAQLFTTSEELEECGAPAQS